MKRRKRRAPTGAFCRYHQPDDKGGPRHNIKRINEPLSPALSPLVPRGERESLRARFGGTDEMRTEANEERRQQASYPIDYWQALTYPASALIWRHESSD